NKEYVPFSVTIDPSKVPGGAVTFYWRVVSKNAPPPPPPEPTDKKDKKDDKKNQNQVKRPEYAYEDVSFVTISSAAPRLARSCTVPAGEYDVWVAVKEPTSTQKNPPPPKASIVKQTVTVPDFWNNELTTSSVIVAQRIDPLPAPLTPQQQVERPYALG